LISVLTIDLARLRVVEGFSILNFHPDALLEHRIANMAIVFSWLLLLNGFSLSVLFLLAKP